LLPIVAAEIGSVGAISPVPQTEPLSYLKLGGKSIELLINSQVMHLIRMAFRVSSRVRGGKEKQSITKGTKVRGENQNSTVHYFLPVS
jgi:hypothetical protein